MRDLRLLIGFRHMAVGEGCLAFGEFFGKPGAARAAASAAVRARKVGEDTFHLFIGIGLAEFRNEQDIGS